MSSVQRITLSVKSIKVDRKHFILNGDLHSVSLRKHPFLLALRHWGRETSLAQ